MRATNLRFSETTADCHDTWRKNSFCEEGSQKSLHIRSETEWDDIAGGENRNLVRNTCFSMLALLPSPLNTSSPGKSSVIAMSPVARDMWKRPGCRLERQRTYVMKLDEATWVANCFLIRQSSLGPSIVRIIYFIRCLTDVCLKVKLVLTWVSILSGTILVATSS